MGKPRESRMLWTVPEGATDAVLVECLRCEPVSANTWWCPSLGITGSMGMHVFDTQIGALVYAMNGASAMANEAAERHAALRAAYKSAAGLA